jgi:MSHA biogenesis protein MshG
MPMFLYKGRSNRGEMVNGQLEGETPESVAQRLFKSGITPIEIKSSKASGGDIDLGEVWRKLGGGKPKTSDLVLFSRQLYTITKSGIPLLRGLRGLCDSTHNIVLREALQDIIASLESGRELAASFSRHPDIFPVLYVSIIRVGESTGTLESSFLRLSEYLQQDQDLKDRVKSAMRYPIIVMLMIAAAVAVITMFVIPKFAPLFKALGDDIPWPTQVLMGVSTFAQSYWYVVLGLICGIIIGIKQYIATETGRYKWDRLMLKLPIVGSLAHEAILARMSRSLSVSLNAGMPMIQTLNVIARSSGNEYMAERVLRLRDAVERGDPLSRAATTVGMFPPLVLQMMAVGEETGELSELLDEVAGFYEREVDYALKNLSAAIEPVMIVSVGVMVCILALGVFLPMWNMVSRVGQ